MVEWDYQKTERGVPHMLASRRGCLGYSKVYCDVRKRRFLARNKSRHITHYIFHIQYTKSEISIDLLYIRPHFVCWHRLNHFPTLVCIFPTSTFDLCLGNSKFVDIRQPFWRHYGLQTLKSFNFDAVLLARLAWHGMVEAVEQHQRFIEAVWKKNTSVSIEN